MFHSGVNVDSEGRMGVDEKSLHLLLNFAVNLKLLLKIKSVKEKISIEIIASMSV